MENEKELRQRAEEIIDATLDYDGWGNAIWTYSEVINAMLKFRSEQTPQPAPQDLRERAEECWSKYLNRTGNAPSMYVDGFIEGVTYASEVSAEKEQELKDLRTTVSRQFEHIENLQQRIAELELSLKQALMMAEAGNKGINQARQRIAELEALAKTYKTPTTYPDPRNYMDD